MGFGRSRTKRRRPASLAIRLLRGERSCEAAEAATKVVHLPKLAAELEPAEGRRLHRRRRRRDAAHRRRRRGGGGGTGGVGRHGAVVFSKAFIVAAVAAVWRRQEAQSVEQSVMAKRISRRRHLPISRYLLCV